MRITLRQPGHVRRLTTALNVAAVTVVLVSALACLRLVQPPPPWTPPQVQEDSAPTAEEHGPPQLTLADLAVIWERDLHQPVVDLPPPESPKPVAEPELSIRLIGTAVEPGGCYAVLQLSGGRTVVRPLGATVDGFEIVSIERGKVRLLNGARTYELTVPWYERIAAAVAEQHDGR